MAAFVLHFGDQNRLALQGWGASDPIALGQHADDFRMRVLGNLTNQGIAIARRHPVLGLDLLLGVDSREKALFERSFVQRDRVRALRIQRLRVHTCPKGVNRWSILIRNFARINYLCVTMAELTAMAKNDR